ncbi:hypothetical protein NDU88_002114 [Pleurodeles waltl]|uniref:Uncharacterized protein n=1 Tax=Pleurodeles waltl TaxID=8319 RepID=A0AAV7VDN6_PLEWA|nr:hypothetical protein NDU88_002114 [Pleurodeles waltl]
MAGEGPPASRGPEIFCSNLSAVFSRRPSAPVHQAGPLRREPSSGMADCPPSPLSQILSAASQSRRSGEIVHSRGSLPFLVRDSAPAGHKISKGWATPRPLGTPQSSASSSGALDLRGGPRPAMPIASAGLLNVLHNWRAQPGDLHRSIERDRQRWSQPPC